MRRLTIISNMTKIPCTKRLPEVKGFSERNIKRMPAFRRAYPNPDQIMPQAVAQLTTTGKGPQTVAQTSSDSLLWQVSWGHHVWLLEKVKDLAARCWYMEQTLAKP